MNSAQNWSTTCSETELLFKVELLHERRQDKMKDTVAETEKGLGKASAKSPSRKKRQVSSLYGTFARSGPQFLPTSILRSQSGDPETLRRTKNSIPSETKILGGCSRMMWNPRPFAMRL